MFDLPQLGIGIGLRTTHYADILEGEPSIDWFEVLSENYMQTRGRPAAIVDAIAERYPVVLHGVAMSIGGTDPLDFAYLGELRALRDRIGARWVSDHLCWTGVHGRNTHDLLPMPYTEESLQHTVERVRQVQDFLEAPLVLENPSTYVSFATSTMTEQDFLATLAKEANCGLLLDVNNVFVSATNHGFDPHAYLRALPLERVVQFHVAGHFDAGSHLVDTHVGPVPDPVWELLREAHVLGARAPVLLEWDAEIPPLDVVHTEALRAKDFLSTAEVGAA